MRVGDATDLEPPVALRDLPIEVQALRDLAVDEFRKRDRELQPHIDAHINAYEAAVQRLIAGHANIASQVDFALGGETRWSGIWELSGRCLSECRLLVHALRGGFALEAASNVRAVHDAMYLLRAVSCEDKTARKWLAGEYIRPKAARAVIADKQGSGRKRMKEAGLTPAGDVTTSGAWLYDHFSQAAQHRRASVAVSVSVPRRAFDYGPHPDADVRAEQVLHIGHLIETALIVVTDTLADIVGRDDLAEVLAEQKEEFERVRLTHPL